MAAGRARYQFITRSVPVDPTGLSESAQKVWLGSGTEAAQPLFPARAGIVLGTYSGASFTLLNQSDPYDAMAGHIYGVFCRQRIVRR